LFVETIYMAGHFIKIFTSTQSVFLSIQPNA